ncbi:hypothetical protein GUITHDRAFT_161963, partial [Guillardia theta CCMP2712]
MLKALTIVAALAACRGEGGLSLPASSSLSPYARSSPLLVAQAQQGGALANRLRGGSGFVEKHTGITFPETVKAGSKLLKFIGAGERKKAILGPVAVNVYAVGMYVDSDAAKAAAPKDEKSANKALLEGSYPKALKIVMARTVGAEKIGNALAESLEPRVKGTDAPLDAFKSFFGSMSKLETNNEIDFIQMGSDLQVSALGQKKTFSSAPLCKAMFDIYLGESPVSVHAKESMVAGLLKMCGK